MLKKINAKKTKLKNEIDRIYKVFEEIGTGKCKMLELHFNDIEEKSFNLLIKKIKDNKKFVLLTVYCTICDSTYKHNKLINNKSRKLKKEKS